MIAKKKTGRKILGSSVAHPLTVRIDDVLRERLQQEADKRAERKHGWNLSQEILMRLNQSLDGDEEDKRKRGPLWAISYLMAQIARHGLLPFPLLPAEEGWEVRLTEQQLQWHRNADLFEAFTVAVNLVLKGIKPKGGTLPGYLTNAGVTPQVIGEGIAEGVLFQFRHKKPMTPEEKEKARQEWQEYLHFVDSPDELEESLKSLQDGYYDEERARRYLGIEWTEAPPKKEDGENG
jgi:hypothetical protein